MKDEVLNQLKRLRQRIIDNEQSYYLSLDSAQWIQEVKAINMIPDPKISANLKDSIYTGIISYKDFNNRFFVQKVSSNHLLIHDIRDFPDPEVLPNEEDVVKITYREQKATVSFLYQKKQIDKDRDLSSLDPEEARKHLESEAQRHLDAEAQKIAKPLLEHYEEKMTEELAQAYKDFDDMWDNIKTIKKREPVHGISASIFPGHFQKE